MIVSFPPDKFNISIPLTSIKFTESIVPLFVIFNTSVPVLPVSEILSFTSKFPMVAFIVSLPFPRLIVSFPLERVNVSFADVPVIVSFPVESVIDNVPLKLFVTPLKSRICPDVVVNTNEPAPFNVIVPVVDTSKEVIVDEANVPVSEIDIFSFPNPPARPSTPEACGLRHLAFAVADLDQAIAHLAAHDVECEAVRVDEFTGKRFTFFRDPDNLPLELYQQ